MFIDVMTIKKTGASKYLRNILINKTKRTGHWLKFIYEFPHLVWPNKEITKQTIDFN